MECLNLHCHPIKINVLKNNNTHNLLNRKRPLNITKNTLINHMEKLESLETNKRTKSINKNSPDIYSIKCLQCKKIDNEYDSSISNLYNHTQPGSLFCTKFAKPKYDIEVKCYEFFEFNDNILIGTKDEIELYICKIFESQKINLEKAINENNNLSNNLKNEKLLNSNLSSEIKNLKIEQENLIKNVEYLNKTLDSEKNKNKNINIEFKKITSENKETIEKEKLNNKNLALKNSELEKSEKEKIIKCKELTESIKEKEIIIKNLEINIKNLQNDKEELKKELNIKENNIKELNDLLIKEKNINQNITKDLNSEKEKNKTLNDKLDNIAIQYNENINKILQQLENEKKTNENLKQKNTELVKKEEINNNEKIELESQLQKKEEELKIVIKNNIPDNFCLKFQSDCKLGEYDIILDINSIAGLNKYGWMINYNKKEGKQTYLAKKEEKTVVVGVIGNKNVGKTLILEKISGYQIPKGFNVKTIGLSIRYGKTKEHNIAILDSAGQETPLLKMENIKNI